MGHHNHVQYNKFRDNRDDEQKREENQVEETVDVAEEVVAPEVEETADVAEEVVAPAVEEVAEEVADTVGVVSGCHRLNVRNRPSTNAAIVTMVNEGDELVLEPCASDEFHKVTLANGVVGYCMKKFITVK